MVLQCSCIHSFGQCPFALLGYEAEFAVFDGPHILVADGEHGHGRHLQLAPARIKVHGKVDEGWLRGVEHHPVLAVDAQAERFVALEHGDGAGVEPRGQHGAHLAATEGERLLQALLVDGAFGREAVGQAEDQLAVHFGEARQPETAEQIIGVVDGAVVGTDDDPGPDGMVVAVVELVAPGAPAGVAHEDGGLVVDLPEQLLERLLVDQFVRPHRPLEDPVAAVDLEPGQTGGVRAALLAVQQHADEDLAQVILLVRPSALAAEDDAYLSAHGAGSSLPPKFLPSGLVPSRTKAAYSRRWPVSHSATSG